MAMLAARAIEDEPWRASELEEDEEEEGMSRRLARRTAS